VVQLLRRDRYQVTAATTTQIQPSLLRSLLIRCGHFFFKARDVVFPLVMCTLAFGFRPLVIQGNWHLDRWIDLLGFAVAMTGQLLRIAVIGYAYIIRGGRDGKIFATSLVQGGLFAHSRNPLYTGNMLIYLGLAIVHGSPWFFAIAIPFFAFAYGSLVAAEEDFLRKKFGVEYEDYCRRVNRFIPSLRGLRATLAPMTFDWKNVLRREYGTPFAWMTSMLALVLLERAVTPGAVLTRGTITAVAITWTLLAIAYIVVRTLKLRGKLGRAA
jgi:protein-S-isoprenylcysteine O-methyltransferase Ste14